MNTQHLYKYHGLGNDFLISPWPGDAERAKAQAIEWCDRHRSIGGDGVLYWSQNVDDSVTMVIFNQDGSRPEMCGNGVRCLALYLVQHKHCTGPVVHVMSDAGMRQCTVQWDGQTEGAVTVDMGQPKTIEGQALLEYQSLSYSWDGVDMGNPHAVVFEMPSLADIDTIGAHLNTTRNHPSFPEGVNVEFVSTRDDGGYDVVVFERGVGRTQACGTGACAVAWAIWQRELQPIDQRVVVHLPGGPLTLSYQDNTLWMQGPAQWTFTAQLP